MSETRAARVRPEQLECNRNDKIATRVINLGSNNDTIENKYSHPYISYMANERLQEEKEFHSKNYLLEIPRSNAKMSLKSAPQILNFVIAKAMSKNAIASSYIAAHSNAASFWIKTILFETINIFFNKNY